MDTYRDFWIAVFFILVIASFIHVVWQPKSFGKWLGKIQSAKKREMMDGE